MRLLSGSASPRFAPERLNGAALAQVVDVVVGVAALLELAALDRVLESLRRSPIRFDGGMPNSSMIALPRPVGSGGTRASSVADREDALLERVDVAAAPPGAAPAGAT